MMKVRYAGRIGYHCEPLEARRLLRSELSWENRETTTDNFDEIFGDGTPGSGEFARIIVDRAIEDWNYTLSDGLPDPQPFDVVQLQIFCAELQSMSFPEGVLAVTDQFVVEPFAGAHGGGGRPVRARIRIDVNGGQMPGVPGGWYTDSNVWTAPGGPRDDSEFTTVIDAFLAQGPVIGPDLYRTAAHEIGHALGIAVDDDLRPGPAHDLAIYNLLTPTPGGPTAPADGEYDLMIGGVQAKVIIDDSGMHLASPDHENDLMSENDRTSAFGARQLISDLDVRILKAVYGYIIPETLFPSTFNTFFANLNTVTNTLTINGRSGEFNDSITIDSITLDPGTLDVIRVQVNGTSETYNLPDSEVDSIQILAGGGNDTIDLRGLRSNNPTTVLGGDGDDTITVGADTSFNINSNVTVNGEAGNDTVNVVGHAMGFPIRVFAGAGSDSVNVNSDGVGAATVIFPSSISLGSLNVLMGGVARLTAVGAASLQTTNSLSVAGTVEIISATAVVEILTGTLSGTGTISGDVINSGIIAPGASPGTLAILGDLTLSPSSTVNIEIAGPVPGTGYDRISVSGIASLGGALSPAISGTYDPAVTVNLNVITSASRVGTFASVAPATTPSGRSLRARYSATDVIVGVSPLPLTTAVDLTAASDSGINTDNVTNINTPAFTGSRPEPGTVRVFANGNLIGSSTSGPGAFMVTSSALLDGSYQITATVVDAAGDESTISPPLLVTIDTTAPSAPAAPNLSDASDTGRSNTDDITRDNTPTFTGMGIEAGADVRLFNGVNLLGSASTVAGTYAITPSALADGSYSIRVRTTDVAGNESTASVALPITIDTVVPNTPSVPNLDSSSDSGVSDSDDVTFDNTPTFAGSAEVQSEVTLRAGAVALGSQITVGGYVITAIALVDGNYSVTARAEDVAGNLSAASSSLLVTIDTNAPAVPAAPDLQAGNDTGISLNDNITNDPTPTFDVASTDAFYRMQRDGVQIGSSYLSGTFTSAVLPDASYAFRIQSVDAAGNVSSAGPILNVQIDTLALAVPTRSFLFETGHSMQFVFAEDVGATLAATDMNVTNLNTSTSVTTSLAYANLAATFTFAGVPGGVLSDGNYRATIVAAAVTDVAGNSLAADAVLDFFIFAGDANRDRSINISDFSVLASRFNLPGTFSQGDFNYDGITNIGDFSTLASKFNMSLPALLHRQSPPHTSLQAGLGAVFIKSVSPSRAIFGVAAVVDEIV